MNNAGFGKLQEPARAPAAENSLPTWALGGTLILIVLVAIWYRDSTEFRIPSVKGGDALTGVAERLGVFIILALLVERTVEVYVTVFKGPLQLAVEAAVDEAALHGTDSQLQDAIARRSLFSEKTKRKASLLALAIGSLFGLCGISILGSLLAVEADMPWPMRIVDILVVGTLLAGGAEPIHQLMETITAGLEKAKDNAKAPSIAPAADGETPVPIAPTKDAILQSRLAKIAADEEAKRAAR